MFKKQLSFLYICLFAWHINIATFSPNNCKDIQKVIIWGHKDASHTHHWIHYAFHKTFKHMGFNTLWLTDEPHPEIDYSNSLFFAHGVEEKHLPQREDCRYILHNIENIKYKKLIDTGRAIILQVYTHDCLDRDVVEIDDLTYVDFGNRVLYMPWATDLLPHEIDLKKEQIRQNKTKKEKNTIHYVGSVGRSGPNDTFENLTPVEGFKKGCAKQGINFQLHRNVPVEKYIALIQQSIMAPALQGKWQCEKGYIPCRIFKNISYGHMGITNSETVYKLFKKKIVFNENTEQLVSEALKRINAMPQEELFALMDFVRDNHTYINRINTLLTLLDHYIAL